MSATHDRSEITDKMCEATVVASIIQHPRYVYHSQFLKSKYFYDHFNGTLYWAIVSLVKRGVEDINANVLSNILSANASTKAELDNYDIKSLTEIVNMSPTLAENSLDSYDMFAKKVMVMSYKRDFYDGLTRLTNDCFNNKRTVMDLTHEVRKLEEDLSQKYIISSSVVSVADKLNDILANIKNNRNEDGTIGIPSMIPALNDMIGGYRRGSLTVFSAAPKMGKSTFLMDEALDKLKNGVSVVYFDSEMSDEEFMVRALASLASVPSRVVENGKYTPEQKQKLDEQIEWLQSKKTFLYHQYMPVMDFDEVYETCRMLQEQGRVDMVVYDYIKAQEETTDRNYTKLGKMCDQLKNQLAGALEIPVLAAVQTRRNDDQVADSFRIPQIVTGLINFKEKDAEEIRNEGNDVAHNGSHRLFIQYNRYGDKHYDGDIGISLCFKKATSQIWQAPNQPTQQAPFDEDEY